MAALESQVGLLLDRVAELEEKLIQNPEPLLASNSVYPAAISSIGPASVPASGPESTEMAAAAPAALVTPVPVPQNSAQPVATIMGADPQGFTFRSPDEQFSLRVRWQMNLDGRFGLERQEPSDNNSFILRRAQPIFTGTLWGRYNFQVLHEFSRGRTRVVDAYFDTPIAKGIKIRAGKFKGPVGLERFHSGSMLSLMERSLTTQLVPNRDLGFMLFGDVGNDRFSYFAGIFNGTPDGEGTDTDNDDNKEFEGRILTHPFLGLGGGQLDGLAFGVGGSYGKMEGSLADRNLSEMQTTGRRTFFDYLNDQSVSGTALADGVHYRVVPHGYYFAGPVGLLWEYANSVQKLRRDQATATLQHSSWQVTGNYLLTDDEATFSGVAPRRPFDAAAGTWGAWEVAARISRLDVDDDAFPLFADPESYATAAKAWAVGLNWYPNRNVRYSFNYEETHFDAAVPGIDLKPERAFLNRFQLRF